MGPIDRSVGFDVRGWKSDRWRGGKESREKRRYKKTCNLWGRKLDGRASRLADGDHDVGDLCFGLLEWMFLEGGKFRQG